MLLDGRDLRDLRLGEVRSAVVRVEQEPFLFHSSLRDNLRYARPEASDSEVESAVRAAGLDDLVAGLQEGLSTVVGERGLALSAGERRRVAVARAFLADPAVLVPDEPSARPRSERRVRAGCESVMKGRTTKYSGFFLGRAAARA